MQSPLEAVVRNEEALCMSPPADGGLNDENVNSNAQAPSQACSLVAKVSAGPQSVLTCSFLPVVLAGTGLMGLHQADAAQEQHSMVPDCPSPTQQSFVCLLQPKKNCFFKLSTKVQARAITSAPTRTSSSGIKKAPSAAGSPGFKPWR